MKLSPALIASSFALLLTQTAGAHEYDALMKAKKYAEAEKAATAKLSSDANNMDALLVKAELILAEGKTDKLDDAAKYAEQCIAAHPQSSECHEMLGNVLGSKATSGGMLAAMSYAGKIRDAFLKAVELDPKNYSARSSLLQYYLMAPAIAGGGKSKAQNLVIETAKINAAAGSLLQASLDLSDDKFSSAETAALSAIPGSNETLGKMQRNTLYGIGAKYVQQKKFSDAERVFGELQQRFPDKNLGAFGMGRSLQEQGKHKEAIAWYEKAQTLDSSAGVFYRLAQCQQAVNDKNKAISNFEKALSYKPGLSKKLRDDAEDQLKALKA
ncbi:tetratricopeptide repeat protein [Undibacterium sp. TS12]|uniref:tetratricopeptide repeat protein n=1 Tax=Undibacterium sp. TS12 TaxID=2908202 RepID=UPI001F4D1743|nr:tetratricopeptide repeat protein [Undibacterium sp. TS12]MCH8617757.1 tetratricopeptide repeat protein [Undibacterium sp. TS12]